MHYTWAMIVTVEVIQDGALNLLSDMERLDLIRVAPTLPNAHEKNTGTLEKKLSEQFAGTLHLSDDKYEEYQDILNKGRNEWARDIC